MTPHDDLPVPDPVRTCVGCRTRAAKRELLRVVVGDGAVVPDPVGSAPGRGAYLHPTVVCCERAERKRAFSRALRYDAGGPRGPLDLTPLQQYLANPVRSAPR